MVKRALKKIGIFSVLCFGLAAALYAAEKDPDLYAPVYTEPLTSQSLKDPLSSLLELPFKALKWPMDKGLTFTEEHRLDKKSKWLYTRMTEEGIKPLAGSSETSIAPFYGAEFNLMALSKLKDKYPDLIATTAVLHAPKSFFLVGSELGAQRIAGDGVHASGFFQYDVQLKEPFYGIGPHTSRGDSTSFRMETTQVGAVGGLSFSPAVDLSSVFSYKHVDILNRAHDGKGDIREIFAGQDIPGINGENLLNYELVFNRDTRDSQDQASKGSYQKLSFKFTDGTGNFSARYFTYLLDAAKYFQLASPRRVLVTRFFAEYKEEIDRGTVPFFEMVKLGSSGTFPSRSQTLRGFVYNRFYGTAATLLDLEYRYTVMEYKEFKLKTVFFSDTGEVFSKPSKFRMKDLRESYGIGLYLSYARNTLLAFSVAQGGEGTRFYLDNKIAF